MSTWRGNVGADRRDGPLAMAMTQADKSCCLPDYHGGSIVNLMSSLIQGLGGKATPYASLGCLPPEEIRGYRRVVLIVIDGLGDLLLESLAPDSCLASLRRCGLTSVFPSTTTSAVTTFLTGLAPQQHGLTGWFMYFRELGAVMSALPGKPRYGGLPLGKAGVDVGRFYGHRPVFDLIPADCRVLAPRMIAHSDFNLTHLGKARLAPHDGLEDFFGLLAEGRSTAQRSEFVYAYWSELDHIAHEFGSRSDAAVAHLQRWDAAFETWLGSLAGSGTLVMVTADHGFIDTDEAHTVNLDEHPEFADCLRLPLCGEPRAAYCHVKPDRAGDFERYANQVLSHALTCHRSADLIDQGWFGLGQEHPELRNRVGDYTLVMRDSFVIRDRLPGERPIRQRGVHGGISRAEMRVPLAIAAT